ncbi:MAG: hypothetical protein ACREUS_12135 [Burkholderiales bacterium]
MVSLKRSLILAAVLLLPSTHAAAQAKMAKACETEIEQAEARISEARKAPEYRSEKGRHVLSTADRWVNQARKHAAKGESRSCVSAAQKGRQQLSAR